MVPDKQSIAIITKSIPPIFAGSGLRSYRYAHRLYKQNRLAFILTGKFNLNDKVNLGFKAINEGSKIPFEKILTVPLQRHKVISHSKKPFKYFLPFLTKQIGLLIFLIWHLYKQKNSFEILHCLGSGNWLSLYAVAIGKLLGKRTVLEMTLLGGDDPISIQNEPIKLKSNFRLWLFSKADIIISISPALTKAYKSSGMPMDKLQEVPNPVNTKQFNYPSKEEKLKIRKKLGFREKQVIVLFAGSIIERKGIDLLIASFAKFVSKHSEALLLMVGSCRNENRVKYLKKINILDIKKKVILKGLVSNVDEYMKASDLFVFTSLREGFPNVIVEAMASRLPVITLNIPDITNYIIRDGIDGIVVKDENPTQIALAMEKIVENQTLYDYITTNAKDTVLNKFSVEIVDQKYLQIYEKLLTK